MTVRETALALLLEYEGQGKYINLSLSSRMTDGLSSEERAFLTALLYTSVEHKITYDYYIASLSGRSIDSITDRARNILRLGLCQITDMDNIPDYAAVNETVKLAKNSGERSFVNGVLRRAVREKDSLPLPDRNKNAARYLSVRYSFPLWTVKKFISVLGESGCEELLKHYSKIPPTDITVNTLKISKEDCKKKLETAGYTVENSDVSSHTLRILGSVDPRKLPGFSEGEFFVQDASCMSAVTALGVKPGEKVADVCSAPGGKSFSAALLMGNEGEIDSFDIHENKLSLISSTAEKLGIKILNISARDAVYPDTSLFGKFDKVICDVPCSGLGVLSKKPDLRYKNEESIKELPSLQYEILKASVNYLKNGGVLLYSTCTLDPLENEGVLDIFLSENREFSPLDFSIGKMKSTSGRITLYPHIHRTDGFFISLIKKH